MVNIDGLQNKVGTIKIKNYSFENEKTFEGVYGSYNFYFETDENWQVQSTFLELIINQSNLNLDKSASLSVYINDAPIYSAYLYDKIGDNRKLNIPISTEYLNAGVNNIRIKTFRRISDDFCHDNINSANWITIKKDSFVHVEYVERNDSLNINDFPYPYLTMENSIYKAKIAVPNSLDSECLEAAAILAQGLGNYHKLKDVKVQFTKYSQITDKEENLILLGKIASLPEVIISKISEEEKTWAENGVLIKEIISPFHSNKRILLITSESYENDLSKASLALTNKDIVSQMKKQSVYITKDIEFPKVQKSSEYNISLEQLGYNSITMEGIFNNSVDFGINIPKNRKLKKGSRINLNVRYSDNLNFDKSLITVYLNNEPVFSEKLNEEKSNDHILEIPIPDYMLDNNYIGMRVEYYLELKDAYCGYKNRKSAWGFVSNKSYFQLPYEEREDLHLEYYPWPFIKENKLNNVIFILPGNPLEEELEVLENVSVFLGKNVKDIERIIVKKYNELVEEDKKKNIIIIGNRDNNRLIKEINDKLYIKFDENYNRYISNEKFYFLESSDYWSAIQLIQSPFNDNRALLSISSTKDEAIKLAGDKLSDNKEVFKLKGDYYLIGEERDSYWTYKEEKEGKLKDDKDDKESKLTMNKQTIDILIITLITLGIVLVSTVLIIRKNRKR